MTLWDLIVRRVCRHTDVLQPVRGWLSRRHLSRPDQCVLATDFHGVIVHDGETAPLYGAAINDPFLVPCSPHPYIVSGWPVRRDIIAELGRLGVAASESRLFTIPSFDPSQRRTGEWKATVLRRLRATVMLESNEEQALAISQRVPSVIVVCTALRGILHQGRRYV